LRGAGALAVAPHGSQVDKCIAVGIHEVFEQPGDLGLRRSVRDIVNQACEHQDLPLADELLRQIRFEVLHFLGERPGQLRLLHALRIHQFFLAEFQHLAMIQANRERTDEQERTKHEPQDAHPAGTEARQQGWE
jgi:hypothetical protein